MCIFLLGNARPFADFFIALLGNYREHIRRNLETKELELDRDAFVASHPRSHQPFLLAVIGSQAFQQFIVERQADLGVGRVISGHFERLLQVPHRSNHSQRSVARSSPVLLRRHMPGVPATRAAAAAKDAAEAEAMFSGTTPFDTGLPTPAKPKVFGGGGGGGVGSKALAKLSSDTEGVADGAGRTGPATPTPPPPPPAAAAPATPSGAVDGGGSAGTALATRAAPPTPGSPGINNGGRGVGDDHSVDNGRDAAAAGRPATPVRQPTPGRVQASSTPQRPPTTPSSGGGGGGGAKPASMGFQLLQLSSPSAASIGDLADAVRLEEEHFQKDNVADLKQTSRVRKLAEKLDKLMPAALQYAVDAKALQPRICAVQESDEPADGKGADDEDGNSVRAAVNKLEKKLNAAVVVAERCSRTSAKHVLLGEAVQLTTALVRLKEQHGDAINCVAGGLASVQGTSSKKKSFWNLTTQKSKFERELFNQVFALLAEVETVGRAHGRARARQHACIKQATKDIDVVTGATTSVAAFSEKLAYLESRVKIASSTAGGAASVSLATRGAGNGDSDRGAAFTPSAGLLPPTMSPPRIAVAVFEDDASVNSAVAVSGEDGGGGAGAGSDASTDVSFDEGSSAPGSPASLNEAADEVLNMSPVHSAAANAAAVLVGAGGGAVLPSDVVTTSCYMGARVPPADSSSSSSSDGGCEALPDAGHPAAPAASHPTSVTKEMFDAFVAEVVCTKFDAFSISTQTGFWKGEREETFVLTVIHDRSDSTMAQLEELAAIYKERYNQDEVLINSLAAPGPGIPAVPASRRSLSHP